MSCVYLESFAESLIAERGVSQNTYESYMRDIRGFLLYLEHQGISYLSINLNIINQYFGQKCFLEQKNSSKARKMSSIKQFYIFLHSEGIIVSNPLLDLKNPKSQIHLPKSLSVEEIDRLIKSATIMAVENAKYTRDACILYLLYSTGMRISEAINLKISDIASPAQSSGAHIAINIVGKGGNERQVIINKSTMQMLDSYLNIRSQFKSCQINPYLFISQTQKLSKKPITRQLFFLSLKKIANHAGIDKSLISPHKIRHSFASHILQNGADLRIVQELLGHQSISSTQIYTKILSSQAINLVQNKHPLRHK